MKNGRFYSSSISRQQVSPEIAAPIFLVKAICGTSGDSKGSVSVGSGNINAIMQQLNKASTALRFVLRGNYPDTYQQVYRDWGWQRESY